MKIYKYAVYVFSREGQHVWLVSTNRKDNARKFASEHGAASYALLFKYSIERYSGIPAGYKAGRGDSWIHLYEWTDAVPEWFTAGLDEGDSRSWEIHRKMEKVAEKVEL